MRNKSGVQGLTRQRRNYLMAIWLGLFAMLMIHLGPLISGVQALSSTDAVFLEHASASTAQQHAVAIHEHSADSHAEHAVHAEHVEHTEHAVDYHALMGHHSAPAGAPQWLADLEMCGYCDLLTISPPLVLVLVLALPIVPPIQWLAVLPAPPKPLPAAHSLRHPRAPPFPLLT